MLTGVEPSTTQLELFALIEELVQLAPAERLKSVGMIVFAHARAGLGDTAAFLDRHLSINATNYLEVIAEGCPPQPLPNKKECMETVADLHEYIAVSVSPWPPRNFIHAATSCLLLIATDEPTFLHKKLINVCVLSSSAVGDLISEDISLAVPSEDERAWQVAYLESVLIHARPLKPIEDRLRKSPLAE